MHNPSSYFSQLDPALDLPFLTYILPRFAELSSEILFLEDPNLAKSIQRSWINVIYFDLLFFQFQGASKRGILIGF